MIGIRQADVTDSDAVYALLQELATSYQPHRPTFDGTFERLLSSMTYDDGADLLVATGDDGQVVGYALALRFLTFYAGGPITELHELVVAPEHRGEGIGHRLVAAIVGRARENGVIEVTVPSRRAKDFYRALGFTETGAYFKLQLVPGTQ